MSTREGKLFFQRARYRAQRHADCCEAARTLFTPFHANWRFHLVTFKDDSQKNSAHVQEFHTWVSTTGSVAQDEMGCLAILNWASPSAISSKVQRLQAELLGVITNQQHNVGGVVMPQFGYKRGMVWQAANTAQEKFLSCNMNGDRTFGIAFHGRGDPRAERHF